MTTMGADAIIKGLDEFFKNLTPEEMEEIKEAFSVEIEGDVTIDEYLTGLSDAYFYTQSTESNCYESGPMTVEAPADPYVSIWSEYSENEYTALVETDSEYDAHVSKKVKKAA